MTSVYEPAGLTARVAVISVHTSPLAPLGGRETGGMNVYVRELSRELGSRGFAVDVFTRRTSPAEPEVQPFGPNARVINIDASPPELIAKQRIADSRALQLAMGKPVARVIANLRFARTGPRVSYTTSISIADARLILAVAAQQLDTYFVTTPPAP